MELNMKTPDHETLVVLIHGFCRGAVDMQFWKKTLEQDFAHIITPDLPTRYGSFEQCLEVLADNIAAAHPERFKQLCFAGHSMGGLMAREYLQRNRHAYAHAKRLVCVGTPHYGSKLADIALLMPFAGRIWKPLHALKCSARKTVTTPEIDGLEIGAIISTNNGHWPGKLFLSKESDGLVERFSAHAPDAKHIAYTNAAHIPMQFDAATAELIRSFLLHGTF